MNTTRIEWATMTWNPITGCSPISEGCANCYAARMAHRLAGRCGYDEEKPFGVTLHKNKLEEPRVIRNPQRIFVCSMGDLFHEDVPFEWINEVLFVMLASQRHRFLVLTKRPERMKEYFQQHPNYINVWLGVTAENQARADERIPVLLSIPAAGHFVSVEPMLGAVNIDSHVRGWEEEATVYLVHAPDCDGSCRGCPVPEFGRERVPAPRLDWVICGAETGTRKREMQREWADDLERQCVEAGVPFFGKKYSDGSPMQRREIPAGLEKIKA